MMTRHRRRGFAIVELLLALTALLFLFGICVALIHTFLRLDRLAVAHVAETTTRERLARRFRTDVHAAAASGPGAAAVGKGDRLELTLGSGTVVDYRGRAGRLERVERKGDRVLHRDAFPAPPRAEYRFEVRDEHGATFVVLTSFGVSPAGTPAPRRRLRVEAWLGRDHRGLTTKGGER